MIGKKVKINIKNPDEYTSDLYNAIQGEIGVITEKNSSSLCYEDAYLVKFGKRAINKYKKTHSGKWGGVRTRMEWWTERKDFDLV